MSDAEAPRFPFAKTRYYGSKRQHIDWLAQRFLDIGPKNVLDPMGGTGTVSHAFSVLGIPVTYSDIFRFNVLAAKGLFKHGELDLGAHTKFLDRVRPVNGTISEVFRGVFFTDEENSWLDGLMGTLQKAPQVIDKGAIFYALAQACLKKRPYNLFHRANLSMRTAKVERSFGNTSTWEMSFHAHMAMSLKELNVVRRSLVAPIDVVKAKDASKHFGRYDLVYLDPPYFQTHRFNESYLQRYHFLEGLANYSSWGKKIDRASGIRSFSEAHSPMEWRCARDLLAGVEVIARQHKGSAIAISYVKGEQPSLREISAVLRRHRRKVYTFLVETRMALSTKARTEALVLATD